MTPPELELRDIHLPDPVSWWPPAPGWWLLLLLSGCVVAFWYWHRTRSRRHRVRDLALAELERLARDHAKNGNGQRLAAELSALLRRVCLLRYPPAEVAGLTGEDWLQFLDRALPSPAFSQGVGRALITAPFQPAPQIDAADMLALCRQWILALQPRKEIKHD